MCTQPRRISAVGVASRVAQEREEKVGGVVGYQIRLETCQSDKTRLMFCTTGILLRYHEIGLFWFILSYIRVRVFNLDFQDFFLRFTLNYILLKQLENAND